MNKISSKVFVVAAAAAVVVKYFTLKCHIMKVKWVVNVSFRLKYKKMAKVKCIRWGIAVYFFIFYIIDAQLYGLVSTICSNASVTGSKISVYPGNVIWKRGSKYFSKCLATMKQAVLWQWQSDIMRLAAGKSADWRPICVCVWTGVATGCRIWDMMVW